VAETSGHVLTTTHAKGQATSHVQGSKKFVIKNTDFSQLAKANRRFPSHFASLVVGESICHAKASITLGFCMGIPLKKKVLDFAHRKQGYFNG
jgi:hypothetical protein